MTIVHNRKRVSTNHKELKFNDREQALSLEFQQDSLSKGKTDDQEEQDRNDDITSTFVTQSDVPAVIKSLVVSVDVILNSAANSDSDDEHACRGNNHTSTHSYQSS